MEKKVTRIKKSKTFVPSTLQDADIMIGYIGKYQDKINEIEAELQKKIEELKAKAQKKLEPLKKERDNFFNSLFAYAAPRKIALTSEKRTTEVLSGKFGWRLTTPRVETTITDEAIIALLKKAGHPEYVRTIEEVDREKMLKERPKIKGIFYVQSDEFFVTPYLGNKKRKTFTQTIDRAA